MTLANQYKNFSAGKLLAGISAVATSCTLQSGQGSNFPTADGTATKFKIVLVKSTGEREICVCKRTAGSDVITFIDVSTGNASVNGRAQEGTTALAFDANDQVELRVTATQLQSFEDDIDTLQTTVSGISGDYLDSDHNPGGANEDDHDTRYYTQAQLYTQTELDTNKPDFSDIWTRTQLTSDQGSTIHAGNLTNRSEIDHDEITDNEATKHRLINDSHGNGNTTSLWSANKIYDQLALKSGTSHNHNAYGAGACVISNQKVNVVDITLDNKGWVGNQNPIAVPLGSNTSLSLAHAMVAYLTTDINKVYYTVLIDAYDKNAEFRLLINSLPSAGSESGTTRFTDGTQTFTTSTSVYPKTAAVSTCSIPSTGWYQLELQVRTTDSSDGRWGLYGWACYLYSTSFN